MVEYITGMDTRIGYPNEHLAGDSDDSIASPLYATAVGLLMKAISTERKKEPVIPVSNDAEKVLIDEEVVNQPIPTKVMERKSIFDKWSEKLKEFLDNAE